MRLNCVNRLLRLWDALLNYFRAEVTEGNIDNKNADLIFSYLQDSTIKSYFYFLQYALAYIDKFNKTFQSNKVMVHAVTRKCKELLLELAQNFIDGSFLGNVETLNFNDDSNVMWTEHIFLGTDCENYMLYYCTGKESLQVTEECLKFYKAAATQMQKRLSVNDPLFEGLKFLDPCIALDLKIRDEELRDLRFIIDKLHVDVNANEIAREWRILPLKFTEQEKNSLVKLPVDAFWARVTRKQDFCGEVIFTNLCILVDVAMAIPHGNAGSERTFSDVTYLKGKYKAGMQNKLLNAECVVRSSFKEDGVNSSNFVIDVKHIDYVRAKNLYV